MTSVGYCLSSRPVRPNSLGADLVDASDVGVVLREAEGESFFLVADGEEEFVEDLDAVLRGLDPLFQGHDRVELGVDDREQFAAEVVDEGDVEGAEELVACEPSFDRGERGELESE